MNPESMISIRELRVSYQDTPVLKGIDLEIRKGEMIALLGASGCGKTTLLRTLAGFTPAEAGRIQVQGRDVLDLPPEQRGMVMVFQSYALWPHMTVAQNIGYGLRLRGTPKAAVARRVDEVLELLGLAGFGERKVTQLSGGQRQRVALGRALAVEPSILLLDEPLSNLDAGIRQQMRHEIRSLQRQLGLTSVLVTHDREEALAMADRVVILNAGRIEQAGSPEEVFSQPATPYVANFMGAANTLACHPQAQADSSRIQLCLAGETAAPVLELAANHPALREGAATRVHFRSEAASLHAPGALMDDSLCLPGRIGHSSFLGHAWRCEVQTAGGSFLVDHPVGMKPGDEVLMSVPAGRLHLFPEPIPVPAH
ncbi:ABC transporter ATP-binding protein [Uliginosibacterium paludis]|uniref:ABC transporter ATP-binding protein n=1 Tax=Uliginosibacterium paludis TaxID=1615952 RepID=A0ABV2CS10_9RHOO